MIAKVKVVVIGFVGCGVLLGYLCCRNDSESESTVNEQEE